jgi:hypothetical protein
MNGVTKSVSMDVYRKDLGLAASDLKLLAYRSPRHFKAKLDGLVPNRESASLSLGTLVHMAVLEPEEFERRAVQEVALDRRTKAYKEWVSEQPEDALILSREQDDICTGVVASLRASGLSDLFEGGQNEISVFAEIDGIELKCRPDSLQVDKRLIVDLKTCRDLKWFASDARNYHYPFSVPHYQSIIRETVGQVLDYIFVAVETEPPFDVGWFQLSPDSLQRARDDWDGSLQTYKRCLETGEWNGMLTEQAVLI